MKKERKDTPLTLEQAQDNLDKISAHRSQLVASRIALNERLETSRHDAAQKYLRGDRSGVQEAHAIGAELQTIETALGLLDENQKAAEIDLERAKVRDLRDEAARKRKEIEVLQLKTGELLRKLSELEGVPYSHSILGSQPTGNMVDPSTLKEPEPWRPVLELVPNVPGTPYTQTPLSRRLRSEADELELKAEQMERALTRQSHSGQSDGGVHGRSLDDGIALARRARESDEYGFDYRGPSAELPEQLRKPPVNLQDAY
jgi:hypothetical protein